MEHIAGCELVKLPLESFRYGIVLETDLPQLLWRRFKEGKNCRIFALVSGLGLVLFSSRRALNIVFFKHIASDLISFISPSQLELQISLLSIKYLVYTSLDRSRKIGSFQTTNGTN